jgi:hypothetical protein
MRISLLVCVVGALTSGCGKELFFSAPGDSAFADTSSLTLTVAHDTVADGASLLRITLHLAGRPTTGRIAALTTTAGAFVTSGGTAQSTSAPFGVGDSAVAVLRAPRDPAVAAIRAAVGQVVRLETVVFRAALADTVLVQPRDSFVVLGTPSGQIALVATLRRSAGFVSPGAVVRFTDSLPPAQAGFFTTASAADTSGRAEVRYTPGAVDSMGRGRRLIYACADAARGGRVCGSTTIFVR